MFNNSITLNIFCIVAILPLSFAHLLIFEKLYKFGKDLYYNVAEENHAKSVVVSPIFVSLGIGMLHKGARGETATEIEQTLIKDHLMFINLFYTVMFESISDIPGITLGNKIYINNNFQVQDEYRRDLESIFSASIEAVDFSRAQETADSINDWINIKSIDLIPQLVSPHSFSDDTKLVLLNTITFNGELESPFNVAHTRAQNFYMNEHVAFSVPLMFQTGSFVIQYHKHLKATSLVLPYKKHSPFSDVSLVIFLPDTYEDFDDLEKKRKNIQFQDLKRGVEFERKVNVYLPRFKVEWEHDLKNTLQDMGLRKSFSDSANFSGIANSTGTPLFVSKFIHKAVIIVDEKGSTFESDSESEASADAETFLANRPFIYFVKGKHNFTLLSGSYKGMELNNE